MITPNMHYADLKDSYLFYNIAQKTKAYLEANPSEHLCRMGIGDVSLPLCDAVIRASCRYSIKAGYQLSDEQIEELIKEITELETIPNCPHGRPIAVVLKKSDLQKGFKRIV